MKSLPARALQKLKAVAAPLAVPTSAPASIGKYTFLRELGRGAVGVVYEGEDTELRRRVAIKILAGDLHLSDMARRRFQREAQSAAGISHPNVVTIHDAGEDDGRLYLVMELVDGETLDAVIRQGRDLKTLLEILEKAARGVGAAHASGVIHRDLKPANIFVTPQGEPKVGDFGLATLMSGDESLTRTGSPVGTPMFMAPEQVQGDSGAICPATDVYGLGAILYLAITGTGPHSGSNVGDLYGRIIHSDPALPRKYNPQVPIDVEAICLKALERNPAKRYANAVDLAEDIRRYLDGRPILARPSTPAGRWWKKVRRHPMQVAIGAAACIAVTIAVVVIFAMRSRMDEKLRKQQESGTQEALAHRLSGVYHDLALRTLDPMRRLQDRWHGGNAGSIDEALQTVIAITQSIESREKGLSLPEAWRGMALRLAGREQEGRAALEHAAEVAGEDPFPHVLLARMALADFVQEVTATGLHLRGTVLEIGRPNDEAMSSLRPRFMKPIERALASTVWSRLNHGQVYLEFAMAASRLGQGEFESSAGQFKVLMEDALFGTEAAMMRGLSLLYVKKYAEAAEAWEIAARRGWPRAILYTGISHLGLGDFEKSISLFGEAIRRLPRERVIYLMRAGAYTALGKKAVPKAAVEWYDLAIADADTAVDLNPRISRGYSGRGGILGLKAFAMTRCGQDPIPTLRRALGDLEIGLKVSPDGMTHMNHASVLQLLGRCLPHEDYRERALPAYTEAIQSLANPAVAYLGRGDTRFELSLLRRDAVLMDQAIEDLEEAVRRGATAPNLGSAYIDRGVRTESIPDLTRGIELFDRAIAQAPEISDYYNRGTAYLRRGQFISKRGGGAGPDLERAVADFRHCIPHLKLWEAHLKLGTALEMLGRRDEAIEAYREALKINPEIPGLKDRLPR